MTIFATQHIRSRANLSWGEEYVIGLVEKTEPITATRIVDLATKQGTVTSVTVRTYLKSVETKKFIRRYVDPEDRRLVCYATTDKGKKLMEELRNAVK